MLSMYRLRGGEGFGLAPWVGASAAAGAACSLMAFPDLGRLYSAQHHFYCCAFVCVCMRFGLGEV